MVNTFFLNLKYFLRKILLTFNPMLITVLNNDFSIHLFPRLAHFQIITSVTTNIIRIIFSLSQLLKQDLVIWNEYPLIINPTYFSVTNLLPRKYSWLYFLILQLTTSSWWSTLAPCFRSCFTMSKWPSAAAFCKAVCPL